MSRQFHAGEFGEWVLGLENWEAFGTFTFEKAVSTSGAAGAFENFIVRHLPAARCFYSVERHLTHGGHLHALLAGVSPFDTRPGARGRRLVTAMTRARVDLWDLWKRRYGRNSIELPNNPMHTARYCAKYMTKDAALWNYNGVGQFHKRETELERLVEFVFPGASVVQE